MSGTLARLHRDDGLDVVVLSSPHNRNALSLQMLGELRSHVAASAAGDGRALVLDHDGGVFCAGVDLRERRELGADASPTHSELLAALLRELWAYPKPVLCRVAGAVRGGGMGLLACADVVVASADATFAYSEVRVGVAPALVLAVTLPKVPAGPLVPWLLTGEAFDAEVARSLGLVTRVAPGEVSLQAEADAIRAAGPDAVRTVKRLARRTQGDDVAGMIAEMEQLSAELFAGAEAREGMAAFAERRAPSWAA